jgi:hypothetical protein
MLDGSSVQSGGGGGVPAESEGYTSFFTTTHTSANNSSDSEKQNRSARSSEQEKAHDHHDGTTTRHDINPNNNKSEEEEDVSEFDTASMIVLARTKRKHLLAEQAGSNPDGSTSSSSYEKRVRIAAAHHHQHQRHDHHDPLQQVVVQEDGAAEEDVSGLQARSDAAVNEPPPEESGSGSSSDQQGQVVVVPLHHHHHHQGRYPAEGGPRLVSESSSSAREQNESSNGSNTTSGSASGGNTGSGQGSSGSGQGSSGSGNEGKGSSEELMAQDGAGTLGQDNSSNSDNALKEDVHHNRLHVNNNNSNNNKGPAENVLLHYGGDSSQVLLGEDCMDAEREKKIQNKKRKRMNMRREYESKVQRQLESSESGNDLGELVLKPGLPVTLDQVLSFTKTARSVFCVQYYLAVVHMLCFYTCATQFHLTKPNKYIHVLLYSIVIQAAPPFLVVHANAAYSRLTGVDAHAAIGKPISSLMSIADNEKVGAGTSYQETLLERSGILQGSAQVAGLERTNHNARDHTAAVAAGRANAASLGIDQSDICLERLLAACGFGRYHIVQVAGKQHQLLGRNVTVVQPPGQAGLDNHREEGSHGNSSITSNNDCPMNSIVCRMGVSPIVSCLDPNPDAAAVITDREMDNHPHRNKKRKGPQGPPPPLNGAQHTYRRGMMSSREPHLPRKNHRHQQITHYAIQLLELASTASQNLDSIESLSATSACLDPNGLTKLESAQPTTNQEPDLGDNDISDDQASASTEPKLPVGAIG